MPATASAMMKDGSPMLLNLREQIANATSKIAPNPYTLWDGVIFTCLLGESPTERLPGPTPQAMLQSAALSSVQCRSSAAS